MLKNMINSAASVALLLFASAVNGVRADNGGNSPGAVAAYVILVIICIGIRLWICWCREEERRRRNALPPAPVEPAPIVAPYRRLEDNQAYPAAVAGRAPVRQLQANQGLPPPPVYADVYPAAAAASPTAAVLPPPSYTPTYASAPSSSHATTTGNNGNIAVAIAVPLNPAAEGH